jgi:hypothetical protein
VPQDYDGHPRPAALLGDFSPRFASAELVAAACVLSFGRFLNGIIELPHAIRPETARAIHDYLGRGHIDVRPVVYEPRAIHYPAGTFLLGGASEPVSALSGRTAGRGISLDLVSTDSGFCFNYSSDRIIVPTNADVVSSGGPGGDEFWLARLAVAAIVAADFDIGTLLIGPDVPRSSAVERAGGLLRAAGLGLRFVS